MIGYISENRRWACRLPGWPCENLGLSRLQAICSRVLPLCQLCNTNSAGLRLLHPATAPCTGTSGQTTRRLPPIPAAACLSLAQASIARLVSKRPGRLKWASDRPDIFIKTPMKNTIDLLDLLVDWAPDEATPNCILIDKVDDFVSSNAAVENS